ncbi:MAG: glycosyltransferase family 2 protein, partial [Lactovum sp.]
TGAFMAGMRYAKRKDYDYVIQFDADGQHLPDYISEMVSKAQEGTNIVIGSRFATEKRKINSLRMFGNAMISLAIKITTGKTLKDPTSGMRLFDKKALNFYVERESSTPEADTVSFMMKKGFVIQEVQVEMQERVAGESYLTFTKSIQFMAARLFAILILQPFRK